LGRVSPAFFFLWLTDLDLTVQRNVIELDVQASIPVFKSNADTGPVIFALVLVNSVNGQGFGHSPLHVFVTDPKVAAYFMATISLMASAGFGPQHGRAKLVKITSVHCQDTIWTLGRALGQPIPSEQLPHAWHESEDALFRRQTHFTVIRCKNLADLFHLAKHAL